MNSAIKILIVEDEQISGETLRKLLEALGHEVCGIAETSTRAIELATSERPDLIFMDILIGDDCDGIETAVQIREQLGIGSIFLSATSDSTIILRTRAANPLGYIAKPYDINSLRGSLELAISKLEADRKLEKNQEHLKATVSRHTLELIESNRELQRQAKVDTTLARISTRFLSATEKDTNDLISESLETIGQILDARTGAVYLADATAGVYRTAYRWNRDDDPDCETSFPSLEIEAAQEFMEQLLTEEARHISEAELLPPYPNASDEALMAPILLQRERAGFIVFAGGLQGAPWDHVDLKLIAMSARVFSGALDRCAIEKENQELQQQLIQSQKMEAVGTLTGGIAHDFNNMLVPILGYSGLLQQELLDHPKWQAQANEIHHAAESAATLTRQLLAFSRRQILEKEVCNLNDVIVESRNMIGRLMGENVELRVEEANAPLYGLVDKGQIQQVLMNLCINARDAMSSSGGIITVRTEILNADSPKMRFVEKAQTAPFWTCLSVTDTGHGMSEETAARIFEPFYSTKGSSGTGLGLSVVHGIVKQHGGEIRLASELGKGSKFSVYLPLQDSKPVSVTNPSNMATLDTTARGERILIVEDEPQVTQFVSQALTSRGYSVETADDIPAARELLHGAKDFRPFDLVLCDCVLPSGNGVEFLVEELRSQPKIKAILTTGYTDRESILNAAEDYDVGFLQKPYSLEKLFEIVRQSLDGQLAKAV